MVVRGCVHGGVVICEVRVAASPVAHGRADRAVPCALLLGGVGDAARDSVRRLSARSFVSVLRAEPVAGRAPARGAGGKASGLAPGRWTGPRRTFRPRRTGDAAVHEHVT